MEEIEKTTLVQAINGDIRSFEEIYKMSVNFVYNVAYRVLNNHQDSQEITQDVFLTVHKKLKNFRFNSSFTTWLYRITVNQAINLYRKNKNKKTKTYPLNDSIKTVQSLKPRQKSDNEFLVNSMLKALNQDQRTCVILRDIEKMSYQQIAETLKININTVRSRLNRARATLVEYRKKGVLKNEL